MPTGTGRGIVITTGDSTVMGRIANLTSKVKQTSSTLALEMTRFVQLVIVIAVCLAMVFFIIALTFGYSWTDAIGFLIGIIVANVPEGLLTTVCVSRPRHSCTLLRHVHFMSTPAPPHVRHHHLHVLQS